MLRCIRFPLYSVYGCSRISGIKSRINVFLQHKRLCKLNNLRQALVLSFSFVFFLFYKVSMCYGRVQAW